MGYNDIIKLSIKNRFKSTLAFTCINKNWLGNINNKHDCNTYYKN